VVASPLPEVRKLGSLVYLARTAQEYLTHIETLLAAGTCGPSMATSRRMDAESWDEKVEELSTYIAQYKAGAIAGAPSAADRQVA
jgi:hypothetical protein